MSKISIFIHRQPISTDPIFYDHLIHHYTMRSVLGTLVTKHHKDGIRGMLAKSWSANGALTKWQFRIRDNLKFGDGSSLTADDVKSSILRMAFLAKKSGSKSGFLEKIIGFNLMDSANQEIEGIQTENNKIVFKFIEPMPRLLYQLSFGLYGVAHKSMYDSISGEWLNQRKFISSGPYQIKKFTDEVFLMELRNDFPIELVHEKAFSEIEFFWDITKYMESDALFGTNHANLKGFKFLGTSLSSIAYIHLLSWNHPKSVFYLEANRKFLREKFYHEMSERNLEVKKMFFPLEQSDGRNLPMNQTSTHRIESFSTERNINATGFDVKTTILNGTSIGDILKPVFSKQNIIISDVKSTIIETHNSKDPYLSKYKFDLRSTSMQINIYDAQETMKFMVLSSEGVRIPDPTGKLKIEVNKHKIDPKTLNEIIYNDAIIWPFADFQSSLWFRPNLIDVSQINVNTPDVEWSFLGQK